MAIKEDGLMGRKKDGGLEFVARTKLPTKYGEFELYAYQQNDGPTHIALVKGNVAGKEKVPIRLHSECVTGDSFGSLRCDCGPQLEKAMKYVQEKGLGVIIHLDQEGRGIGLANKMRAYALQDKGMDTVEANIHLGFVEDKRDYSCAAQIIHELGIKSVLLMTNNPRKINGLKNSGIEVIGRLPLVVGANKINQRYLLTKKEKLGHLIDI